MRHLLLLLTIALVAVFLSIPASATHDIQYRVIHSPHCSPVKITAIGGSAILSLSPRLTKAGTISGYWITLDTRRLSFQKLYLMLGDHGCFAGE